MYLVYGSHLQGYSSFIKSMEDAFLIMLGKANAADFINEYPILGPIIYSSYNVIMLCFTLNIFISIITDAFDELREEAKQKPNDFDLVNFVLLEVKSFFLKESSLDNLPPASNYKDHINVLPEHINRMNEYLVRVNKIKKIILK